MVYDSKTFEILHGLTPEGEEEYRKMLEHEADMILFRHEHPLRWLLLRLKELLKEFFQLVSP